MTIFKRILLVLVLLCVVCLEAKGQDDYGTAQFYRNDCWSRDGLKAHWVLDPGTEGSILINAHAWFGSVGDDGNFETWRGVVNSCTNVPTGWDATCAGGGDVTQETTYIYRNNSSVRIEPSGAFVPILTTSMNYDFAANTAYMVVFYYYGVSGTEDMSFVVGDNGFAETYDFATDTWTAPNTGHTITNAPTAWTRAVLYLTVGPVAKTSYQIAFVPASGNGSGFVVDNMSVQRLKSPSITGSVGNVLSVPVTSDPLWGHSEKLLPRVGTGPAYKTGMELDGVDDYFSCADADCEMDPILWDSRGFFSVGCRLMTDTVAATSKYIMTKFSDPNQHSYRLYRNATRLYFRISDDGINEDTNSVVMFTVDTFHSFVSTFDPSGGSGACENNLYYNAYQIDTDATMTECIPFNSTVDFQIGAIVGFSIWPGSILECTMWGKELTPIEANKYISPHFPATNHGDGFYVDTCSQAASHATCSTQVCRDGTPNACQAEGTGVMAIFQGYTEQTDNNSLESVIGDDSAGNFSDWTEIENLGTNDIAAITAYRAEAKHGQVSARLRLTDTDHTAAPNGYVMLATECIPTAKNDTHIHFSAMTLSDMLAPFGGALEGFYFYLIEYDTAVCGANLQNTYSATYTDLKAGGGWEEFSLFHPAASFHADTSSVQVALVCNSTLNCDTLIDTFSLKEASYRTPWVHCPTGSGTVSDTNRQYELHNPLSDYIEAEGKHGYDGFCVAAWVYTDWTGDDGVTHGILNVPATAGANNTWYVVKDSGNAIYIALFDSAGNVRVYSLTVNSTNWSVGWHYVEACSNNTDNVLHGHHYNVANSTWYDWTNASGAGTGIQNGQVTNLHIGHLGNILYLDGYIPEIHMSPYPSGAFIWPQKGFNQGRPPINHHPY